MLNATWIAVRPQWNFASIGVTNRVQPYCRLAIITMATMPAGSCSHRLASAERDCPPFEGAIGRFLPVKCAAQTFAAFHALRVSRAYGTGDQMTQNSHLRDADTRPAGFRRVSAHSLPLGLQQRL